MLSMDGSFKLKKEKIEFKISQQGIRPNQTDPWAQTKQALGLVRSSLNKMGGAKNQNAYESAWGEYVDFIQQTWVRFNAEGRKISTKFAPWAGQWEKVRKEDPLLNYLIQARHISQHAQLHLKWSHGYVQLKPEKEAVAKFGQISRDENGDLEIEFESNVPDNKPILEHHPGRPSLTTLINRGNHFPPPSHHQNVPILEIEPLGVAVMAFGFYDKIIKDGMAKFN